MANKVFVSVFAAILLALSLTNIFLPKKTFSDNENRVLQTFPTLSGKTLKDGTFTRDFASYIADHFLWRDGFVSIKTMADLALCKTDSGGIMKARDGYLIELFPPDDTPYFEENIAAAAEFVRQTAALGVDTRTLIVPTSAWFLRDKTPRFTPLADEGAMMDVLRDRVPGFVDVEDALGAHPDEQLFYRTDHHWTYLGAYYAYAEYAKARGLNPASLEETGVREVYPTFFGTTYSRFGLFNGKNADAVYAPDASFLPGMTVTHENGETQDSIYRPDKAEGKDKYQYFLGGNEGLITVETDAGTGRSLLLVKDSFANAFLPYIAREFDRITIVDMRYYNGYVSDLLDGVTDALILYQLKFFAETKDFALITD